MEHRATQIFYGLSIFLLLGGLFLLQPSKVSDVADLQTQVRQQVSIAWQQTIGDQPWFTEVWDTYQTTNEFYSQAADATIALFGPQGDSDQDMYRVLAQTYQIFAGIFENHSNTLAQAPLLPAGKKFMSEPAIDNIIPSGDVAGASTGTVVVNAPNSWVTLQDNFTGQLYCLAIYNGEVNKYLGECKRDFN